MWCGQGEHLWLVDVVEDVVVDAAEVEHAVFMFSDKDGEAPPDGHPRQKDRCGDQANNKQLADKNTREHHEATPNQATGHGEAFLALFEHALVTDAVLDNGGLTGGVVCDHPGQEAAEEERDHGPRG